MRRKLSLVILTAVAVATATPARASTGTRAIECGTAHSSVRAATIAATPASEPDPDPQGPLGIGLQVDTKGVTVLAELVTKRVRKQAELRARDAGVAIVERGRASIKVVVRSTPKALGFEYAVVAQLDGTLVPVDDREGRCDPCTHEDVVRRIDALLVRQFEALQAQAQQLDDAAARPAHPAPPSEPAPPRAPSEAVTQHGARSPADTASEPSPSPTPTTPGKPTAPLGAVAGAGIAIGAVGLAGVVAGAVLATRPAQRERVPGDAGAFREVDRGTAGFALVGVGAALVAGGIAMVVTDVVLRQRRHVAAAAVLNSRLVGFSVSGRF